MEYVFDDYKIKIGISRNYPYKFIASIEEFYNVTEFLDNKEQAEERLRPLFDKELKRLQDEGQPIPRPGSGKAKITFAVNEKIDALRPFIDDFWENILGTSYSTSFVSDESYLQTWEHYLKGGRKELINKVRQIYSVDITAIYHQPIYIILNTIISSQHSQTN